MLVPQLCYCYNIQFFLYQIHFFKIKSKLRNYLEFMHIHTYAHAHTHTHTYMHTHKFNIHSPAQTENGISLLYSSIMACKFKSLIHSTEVSVIHIYELDPEKTKSVTHARILLVWTALAGSCCGSHFSYRLASGKLNSVMGKCLMCVCHCADNWKNLTPVHSVPSMLTAKVCSLPLQFSSPSTQLQRDKEH
jgi:hypothetical protein